jgi:predicted PurR-regulated permease PerM
MGNIIELLNYGVGTAIAIVLLISVIGIMNKLVNHQTTVIQKMSNTLEKIANTMAVIQDNVKDLQSSQDNLWREFRNIQRGDKDES